MATDLERMASPLQLKNKITDFLIVGSLCNNDLFLASQLIKMGFKIKIVRYKNEIETINDQVLEKLGIDKETIEPYINKYHFLKLCFRSKVIFSFSGSLVFFLGKYNPLIKLFFFPPVISYITGSDLMEQPFKKNLVGWLYRFLFKNSSLICLVPMKPYIEAFKRLRLNKLSIVRHPFLLHNVTNNMQDKKTREELIFLHISNIDWGHSDKGTHRKSTKGSKKFIDAFIKASRIYPNIRCLIMERGPDYQIAKEIINKENCKAFQWIAPTTQMELPKVFELADVVVDQFDLGAFGGIAVEALSCGKPVLTYLDKLYIHGTFYNDVPPIFNVQTEQEIYEKIQYIVEHAHCLPEIGFKSREWVVRNYDNPINFIDIFMMLDSQYGYNFLDKCIEHREAHY
jgi:glycosyltransferase involved in cell wall biosynthesis